MTLERPRSATCADIEALPPHVVVPDLAACKSARFTETADGPWCDVAPDWVCKILSPSTAKKDRGDRMRTYAACNIGHLWLIEPKDRLLEVFQRQDSIWLRTHSFADTEIVSAPPFDAISFSLGQLWPFDPLTISNS
jgi:Uma2 family endonuclease